MEQPMRPGIRLGSTLGVAVAATALLITVMSVQAPSASATSTATPYAQSVTVLAPEVVRTRVGTGRHGQPVEVASLAAKVSYADLDLTRPSDQKVFKDRIWSGARAACRELAAKTPLKIYDIPHDPACAADAASAALKVADEVIAAANQG